MIQMNLFEKQKTQLSKPMGQRKSRSKRKVHNNTGLPQETKISKNHLTYHLREKEQTKPKVSRRHEIIKIRKEINKMELKEQ